MDYSEKFYRKERTLENQWRAIILFGDNTTSYKFALARSLIEISQYQPNELILLDELAKPFSKYLCAHIKENDKQGTNPSNSFLDACRRFNSGEINQNQLIESTVKLGFKYVLGAFHNVNRGAIPDIFFIDERKQNNGIKLTENFYNLFEQQSADILHQETEARWRLVEKAWSLNMARHLIDIKYDQDNNSLFTINKNLKRVNITSSRDALNGYQKSKCFYCKGNIDIVSGSENLADVDHFIPFALSELLSETNLDGVWNLVLACKECNRGKGGKFDSIPTLSFLEDLDERNEYLISSHHPLRETIIGQTGLNQKNRHDFLQGCYSKVESLPTWEPLKKE